MLKALVIKELRESAGIISLAVLAWFFAFYLGSPNLFLLMPQMEAANFPFVNDTFVERLVLVVGALAAVLGFRQTSREAGKGTYEFLLHRPATRRFVFGAKLLVGGGLVLVLGGVAIYARALWAATPGNSPTPFFWSMTTAAWIGLLCLLLVYLGAFLSGLRPARWFGTRLAPLLAASGLAFALSFLSWWAAVIGILVVAAIIIAAIFYCAEARDY